MPRILSNLTLLFPISALLLLGIGCSDPEFTVDAEGRYVVTTGEDHVHGSLRSIVEGAPWGATITFADGLRNITVEETIDASINLSIINDDEDKVVVTAEGDGVLRFFEVVTDVHIQGLEITGSSQTALRGHAAFTVVDSIFVGNGSPDSTAPSAIDTSSSLHIEGALFSGNANTNIHTSGGAHLFVDDVRFELPSPDPGDKERFFLAASGPIEESATLANIRFDGDEQDIGGFYYHSGADLLIEDVVFENLHLAEGSHGGALQLHEMSSNTVELRTCHFQNNGLPNSAGPNGAITVNLRQGAQFIVESCHFQDNFALGQGAAIHLQTADPGDALHISHSHFSGHRTGGTLGDGGGAVFARLATGAEVTIEHSQFIDNETSEAGGALQLLTIGNVFTEAQIQIRDSLFQNNRAHTGSGALRASLNDSSTLLIERSLFDDNSSFLGAAALAASGGARFTALNSTFSNNKTGGDQIIETTATDSHLSFLTVVNNESSSGAALLFPPEQVRAVHPSLHVSASLFANNLPLDIANHHGDDVAESVDITNSLFSSIDDSQFITDGGQGNIIGPAVADGLLSLNDNGGPSHTIALDPTHPGYGSLQTIDCNDTNGVPVSNDQRQSPRPVDGTCTVGAWERDQ